MFNKEIAVLSGIKVDWNIDSYRELLVNYSVIEKKTAFFLAAISDLQKLGDEISSLIKKREYQLLTVNGDKPVTLISKVERFNNQFAEIKKYRTQDAKVFDGDGNLSTGYYNLTRYEDAFKSILNGATTFKSALQFYTKFTKLGAYNESRVNEFYKLINAEHKAIFNPYLPADCVDIIGKITKVYNDRNEAEAFIKDVSGYVEVCNDWLSEGNNFSKSIEQWDEMAACGNGYVKRFNDLRKTNKSVLLDQCEKDYMGQVRKIIESAKEMSNKTRRYLDQIESRGRNLQKFTKFLRILWLCIMGAVAIYSVVQTIIVEFQSDKMMFVAIIVGIFGGLFNAVIRVIAFCGFGVAWMPEMFTAFEFFENCALYLNILIIGLGLLVIILSRICTKYQVYDSEDRSEVYVGMFLVAANIALLLLYVIYTAIVTCIGYWTEDAGFFGSIFAGPIACVVGAFGGLFRALLLVIGGGYWGDEWADWYLEAGIDGTLCNTALYNLVVALIIVFLISAFVGETDNKYAKLIKKSK